MKRFHLVAPALFCLAIGSAGCARLGLIPLPDDVQKGPVEHGLDAFPEPMHAGEEQHVGLDPFPAAMHPKGSAPVGLTPFPESARRTDTDGKFGLDPFPKPINPGESAKLGLNPFPKGTKKAGTAAAAKGTSGTVETDVPESEEYPTPLPVVPPGSPERSGQANDVDVKKTKKPASWKDD